MREALEPQSACNEGGTQDAISRNQHAMRDIIKWRTMPAAAWALLPWLELRTTSARTAPAPSARGTRGLWKGEGGPGAVVSTCMLLGEVINGHQRSSVVISGHQRSSVVISGHQRSSVVLSAYLAGRASSGPRARATGVEELHYSRHARGTRRAAAD